jgi:Cu-Zn family superoxide dismutase
MGTVMVGTVIVTPFAWAHQGLSADPAVLVMGSGTLTSPNPASKAITYNPDLAPIGAAMTATLIPTSEGSTRADLTILGFPPTRSYVVDAHTKPCGITAAAAGPLFQDQAGTAATSPWPSSDARRAKPATGIRLAVRTDTVGTGTSHTTVPFALTDQVPRSVVLRIGTQTATGPNQADTTGARIACLTLSRK